MSDQQFLSVYRAITGPYGQSGEKRIGIEDSILRSSGILSQNYSSVQRDTGRTMSLGTPSRRVYGLPVFFIESTAKSWAEYPFYEPGARPAVIEAHILLSDIEEKKITVIQNRFDERSDRVLTVSDLTQQANLGGEFYLQGELDKLNKSIIAWRPNQMQNGKVIGNRGWHREGNSFIETLFRRKS